ncbi:DUF6809 domain-containing protein, partial [Dysosmobacter welbionis]
MLCQRQGGAAAPPQLLQLPGIVKPAAQQAQEFIQTAHRFSFLRQGLKRRPDGISRPAFWCDWDELGCSHQMHRPVPGPAGLPHRNAAGQAQAVRPKVVASGKNA